MTENDTPGTDRGSVLTSLARGAIEQGLRLRDDLETDRPAWLREPQASFVTLTIDGRLRGCIGSLVAHRPLGQDVASNAQAAAFADPRFPGVRAGELDRIAVEVSLLEAAEPMSFTSRADALGQLRPGVDGVILTEGGHRATFLPQVWEELPSPDEFIAHLMRKAGLPPAYWSDTVRLERYGVTAYRERR